MKKDNEISKTKSRENSDWKLLLKPFLIYWLIFFIPASICVYIWLKNDNATFPLIIFLGAFFSSLGAVLAIAIYRYTKSFFNPAYGAKEDFKRQNGYYPKTRYHAFASLWLRAIRIFAIYYIISTLILDFENTRLVIGTALLCIGVIGLSSIFITKTIIRPDVD
jgi:hypothetical protein